MHKYWSIFRLALIQSIKNYKGLIGLSLFLVTCLLVFAHLWKIAALKLGVSGLNPDDLLWYIALNEWILIAIPEIQLSIEQDLRSGKLAYLLPRPISYVGAAFAEGFGILCIHLLVLGAVAFCFTWWQLGAIPFKAPALLSFFVLGLLASIVALIFQIAIGLSSFWIRDVTPCNWIWEKFLFALGGLILPLSAYPSWLQKIASFTPFPAILGQRSALALSFGSQEVLSVSLHLLFWGIFGVGLLFILYRKGLKILNIEGG